MQNYKYKFDIQYFAISNPYGSLDNNGKKNIFNTSVPHLRMLSAIVNSPFIKPLVNHDKQKLAAFQKWVAPVLELVGATYKLKVPTGTELGKALEVLLSSANVADSLLEIIDMVTDADSGKTIADFSSEITSIISEITNITNNIIDGEESIFTALAAPALAYAANIVATFDGVTPAEKERLAKSAVKLIGEEVTSIIESVAEGTSATAPFGPVDIGVSVLIGVVEIISEYEDKLNYYNDDGLPEDIAFKEALLDAVPSGLHDGFSNYAKGVDDVIFDVGQVLGNGFKWLGAAFTGNLDNFKFTMTEMNYVESFREIARRGE